MKETGPNYPNKKSVLDRPENKQSGLLYSAVTDEEKAQLYEDLEGLFSNLCNL